jgi:type I restriction enzyme R subunit
VVTTSRLLSTGVDVQTCKNIVLFREVNSMTEFKQIIGRGTRVREDKEKLFFTILDYTGSATRKFADPDFDGDPPLITEEEIDENGDLKAGTDITISDPAPPDDEGIISDPPHPPGAKRQKFYITEGEVRIVAESVQITGADGKLRTIHFTQYAREQIATLFPSVDELRIKWSNVEQRNFIFEQLEDCGISVEQLMDITHLSESDPFDLLCFVAYDLKPKTRKQRADLIKRNKPDFFAEYSVKAQHVLQLILEKYVEFGLNQIRPDIISSVPINAEGNEIEIVNAFGGIEIYRKAIEQLQVLLYEEAA